MTNVENVGWSDSEDRRLARMWLVQEPPATMREIADALDKSKSAVDRRINALGLRGQQGNRAKFEEMTGVSLTPAIRPVRVALPAAPKATAQPTTYTMLVWSDVHFPFQDDKALSVLRQVAVDADPRVLMCLGDVFDFFELSDHRESKFQEPDLQLALDMGVQHLADMRAITNAEEAYFMGGNHEDRWDRLLIGARRDPRLRHLLQLPKLRQSMEFSRIVGFDELGYQYIPYMEAEVHVVNDRLVCTHGDFTGKHVAAKALDKYGMNVIFGHMHRIQSFTRRDMKGQEAAWCIGCLCTLRPHYESNFSNWHQGFAVVEWFQQENGEWLFNVEQIRVHHGVAVWRGKTYTG